MSDNKPIYRSPSREYLVGLLSGMRGAGGQAQRALMMFQEEEGRITQQVRDEAEQQEWSEEATQKVLDIKREQSKLLGSLSREYQYWHQRAMLAATQLQAEASVYWLLYEEPPQPPQPVDPMPVNDGLSRYSDDTTVMPAVIAEEVANGTQA